jgi:glycosyltransferase involved in cell wall biosynthesis
MISIVCVYNNKKILDKYLLRSLKKQTVNYELILLDNLQGKFKSASRALNYGGEKSRGKYIMFVHQDIMLDSDLWLEKAENIIDGLTNFGIAGVAGRSEKLNGVITNVEFDIPPRHAGSIYIKEPMKVQTLDECLVIIPKLIFNKFQFDEKACNNWHLYAVDYCLDIKKRGYNVFVIPMCIYHLSTGSKMKTKFNKILDLGQLPKGYYLTLKKLLKKHKVFYKKIYTTCGIWETSTPFFLQRILTIIKNRINRNFRKIRYYLKK